jgi:glutamyl-tRNA synthetase
VGKSSASFDPKKLWAFQDHYMREVPLKQKVPMTLAYLQKAGLVASPPPCEAGPRLGRIIEALGDRLKVAGDILLYADFFFREQVVYDEAAFEKRVRAEGARQLLSAFKERLTAVEPFEAGPLEECLNGFVSERQIKTGDLIHTLRVAVTGKPVGPGLYDCLSILGKPAVMQRIDRALARD